MTSLLIMYAPSTTAANNAEVAVNGGTIWNMSVSLALRSGRYLAVLCNPTDKPAMISNALAAGWRFVAHGGRVSGADLLESDIVMIAYISGRLDERGV